ncbi:DUF309 domain-containing protein [Neobacillus niacini]|uniref:DUF309 domain-containing protein n=1 Tax=Neobacillus niacini TaxID=86668 RepID=UPI002854A476|nr:DUF309 domain-containing protein [Neobacillus niacini]MDR6998607.1 putative metal-dependent hydrolase [Neobacillus niacini]
MYPTEFVEYMVHFHGDRDYFECHEILEEYWKRIDPGNKESIWVGFIQLAVANYHHRRTNIMGAKRTLEKAIAIFKSQSEVITQLGLEYTKLIEDLNGRLSEIEKRLPYSSMVLPICNSSLLEECKHSCKRTGFDWGKHSDLTNASLVHRHKLRDRTGVLEERERAFSIKKRQR